MHLKKVLVAVCYVQFQHNRALRTQAIAKCQPCKSPWSFICNWSLFSLLFQREHAHILLKPAGQFYDDYDPSVNVEIMNCFATAAQRMGHSLLRDEFGKFNKQLRHRGIRNIQTKGAFFDPTPYDWIVISNECCPWTGLSVSSFYITTHKDCAKIRDIELIQRLMKAF